MDEQIYEAVRECPLDDVVITDRYDNLVLQWEGRMRTPWKISCRQIQDGLAEGQYCKG